MKCGQCGAENLDGAKKCMDCGGALGSGPGKARDRSGDREPTKSRDSSDDILSTPPSRSQSGLVLWIAATFGVFAVLGMFLAAGSGGGGGGAGGAAERSAGQATKEAASVTTTVPTPEQAERVRGIGTSIVASDFPKLVGVAPWISAYAYRGTSYLSALYTTATPTAGADTGAPEVLVRVNEGTGAVNVIVSFR